MSIECGECEMDARAGHADDCSRRPRFTAMAIDLALKAGAERERRRIRRAQREALRVLGRSYGDKPLVRACAEQLDAATRAPRKRK